MAEQQNQQDIQAGPKADSPAKAEAAQGKGVGALIRRLRGGAGHSLKSLDPNRKLMQLRTFIREFRFTKPVIIRCIIALAGAVVTLIGILIGFIAFFLDSRSRDLQNAPPLPVREEPLPPAGSNLSGPEQERFNQLFHSFSVLAEEAFLRNLGLEDADGSGSIERGTGEGYETFIQKYGNADQGFWVNTILQGAGDGLLEEAEIVNHYYLHIRYNFPDETGRVEAALREAVRKRDLPLVWMDDRSGTALKAAQAVFQKDRIPWPSGPVREDDAARLYQQLLRGLRIRGLAGDPGATGYYQLPDFTRYRAGYCFEAAQFGFWFFSLLKINALPATAMLSPTVKHQVIKFINTGGILDYFGAADPYRIPENQWRIDNPLQSLGAYYSAEAQKQRRRRNAAALYEQAVSYNKYNLTYLCSLLNTKAEDPKPNYPELIAIGEFALQNVDIQGLMLSRDIEADQIRANLELILSILIQSYSGVKDRRGFDAAARLLNEHFYNDEQVQPFLNQYRF
ncbi:MAG: hypothetical protein LBD37_07975 [Treponema sp.]|nr:hypothetical protein [Treponema sp.]